MKTSTEIRQDKATREWVIYSRARGRRPKDFGRARRARNVPPRDEGCPFCPGNDHLLPSIIFESRGAEKDWQVRVVPNKYPALIPHGIPGRFRRGIYLAMQGYGHHEVIIETPLHNRPVGLMSLQEIQYVVETYQKRYHDLMKEDENMMIIIFRNHGERAGTSLIHPHSQLIATGMVPNYIRRREEEAQRYFDEWGRCVYCDILEEERKEGLRIVYESGTFTAFVPFAAGVPFEVWIMPNRHKADFGDVSDEEKADFSLALQKVMSNIHRKLNDPDYNYILNTSVRYRAGEPQLHWYLQIRPRLMTTAGFEIGSGININPSVPEEDAEFLRSG